MADGNMADAEMTDVEMTGVEMTGATETKQVIDLREVCCGLVPQILAHLAQAKADEVEVLVRPGIEPEVVNGFGSGGAWNLTFLPSLGHGLARFTRRKDHDVYVPVLDLLDY